MKLDKDLVRDILLGVEASSSTGPITLELDGIALELVSYHVMLLDEAGFLKALDLSDKTWLDWRPTRLTYTGHELLDTIRDGALWHRVKAMAQSAGVASVGALWEVAKAIGKQAVAEKLGVKAG